MWWKIKVKEVKWSGWWKQVQLVVVKARLVLIKLNSPGQGDGFMNITMEEVVFTDARGAKVNFDSFFVQNRLIRCWASLTWSPGHLIT